MPRLYVTKPELIDKIPINGVYQKIFEVKLDKPLVIGAWVEALAEFQVTNDMDQQVGFFSKIILQTSTRTNDSGAVWITRSNGGNSTHNSDHHHQITKGGWIPIPSDKLNYDVVQLWCKAVWQSSMDGSISCPVNLGYGQMCVKLWSPEEIN